MSCPAGFSSDTLFRYAMPVGPFSEPHGADCYFHQQAYDVLAGLLIAAYAIFILVVLIDLPSKRGWILKMMSISLLLGLSSGVAALLSGSLAPQYFRATFAVTNGVFIFAWNDMFFYKMVQGNVALLRVFSSGKSDMDILGGRWLVMCYTVLMFVLELGAMVGAIGAAATYDAADERLSLLFFQVFAVMFASYACAAVFLAYWLVRNFLRTIRSVQRLDDNLKDLVHRFQLGERVLPAVMPFIMCTSLLHAFFLPLFWFLLLVHLLNNLVCGVGVWYAFTATNSKQKLVRQLTCGLLGKKPSSSSTRADHHRQTGVTRATRDPAAAAATAMRTRPTIIDLEGGGKGDSGAPSTLAAASSQ